MANEPCADLDELELQAGERPIRHGFLQPDIGQEDREVVGYLCVTEDGRSLSERQVGRDDNFHRD